MKSAPSIAGSKGALAALAMAAAAACASTDHPDELTAAKESWRGATYDQVLMAWGTPSTSGLDSHTWMSGRPDGRAARCDRTLAFREGRVVDGRWMGDPALCNQFARRR